MFRRLIAGLLSAVLVAGVLGLADATPSTAADAVVENVVTFSDVPESAQFHKEISWLASNGISTGWDVGGGVRQYRPLESIARDAMAAFLYRKAGAPAFTPPAQSPFTDVAPHAAFYKEITWLAAQGISLGWDIGAGRREYRPLNPIARDAMAAFLFRYAAPGEFAPPTTSPFADVKVGADFYREITWLASSGISTGWDIGGGFREYRPLTGIARDAMAAFLYRYSSEKVPADPAQPAVGTVTVAPDVEVLDSGQLDSAQLTGNTLALPNDQAKDIRPNDVLVAGVTEGTPEGLLSRVVQVLRDPSGTTVLTTKPATLTDAIVATTGLLELSGTPNWSTFSPEPDVTELANSSPITPQAVQAEADIFSRTFGWKKTFKAQKGTPPLEGTGSITISSTAKASAKAKMTLEAGFLQLKEASVVVTPSLGTAHSITAAGELKGTISAKLGELNSGFTFMAGPVPVVVTTQLKIAANLTVSGAADIAFTSSQTVSSSHGFKYRDGNFNLISTKPTTSGVDNTVKASASLTAKASLDFDAKVKLYGLAGITFGAGPYVSAAIQVTTTSQGPTWACPLDLGFAARLGVTAGIEVMGFKLGDWTDTTTSGWTLQLLDPCKGTAVTSPGSGTTPTPAPSPSPTTPSLPSPSTMIKTGVYSTFALGPDGKVWAWGDNTYGQLGNGGAASSTEPSQIAGLSGIQDVVSGGTQVFASAADGTLWAWGNNTYGQLGTGTTSDTRTPTQVKGLTGISAVKNLGPATYALKADGTVWAWGDNSGGQLGDGTTTSSAVPVQVTGLPPVKAIAGSNSVWALTMDGAVWTWSYGKGTPTQFAGMEDITAITDAGAIASDGTAWSISNTGTATKLSGPANVRELIKGNGADYALEQDGTVWGWGYNGTGALGNGTRTDSSTPVKISGLTGIAKVVAVNGSAYAIKSDKTVWVWGANLSGQLGTGSSNFDLLTPTYVPALDDTVHITTGVYAAFAVKADGTVFAWGEGAKGQLGTGSTSSVLTPAQVRFTS